MNEVIKEIEDNEIKTQQMNDISQEKSDIVADLNTKDTAL